MNIKKRELIETINCCGTGKQCRGDFKWRYSFVLLVFFHPNQIENIDVFYPIEWRIDAGQNLFSVFCPMIFRDVIVYDRILIRKRPLQIIHRYQNIHRFYRY